MTAHKKLVLAILLFAVIGMIGLSTAVQGGVSNSPALNYTAAGVEPNPQLNVNATYSTFYHNYKEFEYYNGTGNATLHAGLSSFYKNPITVNPTDIESPILQENITHIRWQNPAIWKIAGETITNTSNSITFEAQDNSTTGKTFTSAIYLNPAYLPNSNLQYDYITITGTFTETIATTNGLNINIWESNQTATEIEQTIHIYNNTAEIGKGTSSPTNNQPFYMAIPLSNFLTNPTMIQINPTLNTPAGTGNEAVTITGMAMTTSPLTLGSATNSKNITYTPTGSFGNIHLSNFAPNFAYSEVANGGYTVALSQPLQNATISQSSINDGKYVESATYQGVEQLPSAPDLTYGNANISMNIALPGTQYKVLNVNGQSYTNTVSTMKNGTFTAGSVNPTHANEIIVQVYYTSAQWNSVSSPPGFFSNPVATIEYYWYIFLGITLGAIGLGAGIKGHAQGFRGAKR